MKNANFFAYGTMNRCTTRLTSFNLPWIFSSVSVSRVSIAVKNTNFLIQVFT